MLVWQNSQNYAPRYRGQLNAQLPSALPPRAIVHSVVHGTSWHSFDYSPNRHEITVYYDTRHWLDCTSHGFVSRIEKNLCVPNNCFNEDCHVGIAVPFDVSYSIGE